MYPGLVSCPFYAISIYPFKFMKFFIYLYRDMGQSGADPGGGGAEGAQAPP